ncbi:MAG: helix-turn-helix transcriptional regulator [Oscillospiraceae bacterium]|nr:helix-turn-helix transcriptional regulator [Oscillospiraceae bacterium]
MYVDYKELGKRIAARRRELGLKQSQVNEMAGLSDKYLSNIERATSVLSVDVLMRLCSVLDTTPDHLLLGTTANVSPKDYQKNIISKTEAMSQEQLKLLMSLLDWIISMKL